jgi:hypothetical protein
MMFPTAAYLQASQNAADMQMRGQEALGKGIASGISSVAGAYGDYKKMQSSVKASENAYETFKSFLDPGVQQSIDTQIESMNKDTGVSLKDKAAFWEQAKGMMGGAINQKFAMDKQREELNAAAARQASQIFANQMQPYYDKSAALLMSPNGSPIKGAGYGGGRAPGSGVSLEDDEPFQFNKRHL